MLLGRTGVPAPLRCRLPESSMILGKDSKKTTRGLFCFRLKEVAIIGGQFGISQSLGFNMLKLVLLLIAISSALLAVPLLDGQYGSVTVFLRYYTEPTPELLAKVSAIVAFIWLAISALSLIAMRNVLALKTLAVFLLGMAVLPLISLFGPIHYIAELGGFPMLGSGQGVIKYLAILVLAISLMRINLASRTELFWLNYTPVALVLLWIGGMKFFAFEAEGIVDLVSTSPLLSWLYLLFDQQNASNFIGSYDLIALILLGAGYFWTRLFIPGFLLALAVFATTQTFLITFAGSWTSFGVLTGSGAFIVKDLWFIANMALMWQAFYQGRRD